MLAGLPDLSNLTSVTGELTSQFGTILETLENFETLMPTDVLDIFNVLESKLNIDISDLENQFPELANVVIDALPPETGDQLQMLVDGYTMLRDVLRDVQSAPLEEQLITLATEAIGALLKVVEDDLIAWAQTYIDPAAVEMLKAALDKLQEFQGSLPTEPDAVVPFILNNFIGISPNVFTEPMSHTDDLLSALTRAQNLGANVTLPAGMDSTYTQLAQTVTSLQIKAEGMSATAQKKLVKQLNEIADGLQTIEDAINEGVTAAEAGSEELKTLLEQYGWQQLFDQYTQVLTAIQIPQVFVFEDILKSVQAFLDSIDITTAVTDLTARLQALNAKVVTAFDATPLRSLREQLLGGLETARQTIEQLPTEKVQELLDQGIVIVQEQVSKLHLDEVKARIEQALNDLQNFVVTNINDVMQNKIMTAVNQALSVLDSLSLQDLINQLGIDAIIDQQIMPLFDQLQAKLDEYTAQLESLLAKLDDLSFKPVGDLVVKQIDGVKAKLAAINPTTLSAAEKMAIKGAVAIVEQINIDQMVAEQVKGVFDQAEAQVKGLLDQITELLNGFWDQIMAYGPETLVKPVYDIIQQAVGYIDKISANLLFHPLYEQLDIALEFINKFSPENLLDPLQPYYEQAMEAINQYANPAVWLQPIQDMYTQMLEIIQAFDPGALFDKLEAEKDKFFAGIKAEIIGGFDAIPPYIAPYTNPIFEGAAEAILGNPSEPMTPVKLNLTQQLSLNVLFEPLDAEFDKLLALLKDAPLDEVVKVVNQIHEILAILSPTMLRAKLQEMQDYVLGLLPDIPLPFDLTEFRTLAAEYESKIATVALPEEVNTAALRVKDRFNALVLLLDPQEPTSVFQRLSGLYDDLKLALQNKVVTIDVAPAQAAYDQLLNAVLPMLPPVLRQPTTIDGIMTAFNDLRPSVLGAPLQTTLDRLIGQLTPLETELENGINALLAKLREMMGLIDPFSLRDPLVSIYDTIIAKIPALDLTEYGQKLFDMLIKPLEDINPAGLKPAIGTAYRAVRDALVNSVKMLLDTVRDAIDAKLIEVRETIKGLVNRFKGIIDRAVALLNDLIKKIQDMVFTMILARLKRLVENLGMSFDKEVDRIVNSFRQMLKAVPV